MAKETDLMKVGLYALAGFGAYALYNKYMNGEKGSDVVVVEDDATSSFTGTAWQNSGRDTTTSWQRGNVFANASGNKEWLQAMHGRGARGVVSRDGEIKYSTDLSRDEARVMARKPWGSHAGGTGKRGRYLNMQGTDWQRTGQALNTGTEWQDVNMNASGCGSCGA